jgi:C-3',4' desaturase CrtD
MFDVAIVGAGMAGMATAARLQASGLSTVVLEAHSHAGGCAGYFRRRGFSFDVGATTLVDFEPGGLGGDLLAGIGMQPVQGEALPGYVAWLPDRQVTLHRNHDAWAMERLHTLGDSPAHRAFWAMLDRLANAFWEASRSGIKLPMRHPRDLLHNLNSIALPDLPLLRALGLTMGDALRQHGLRGDAPLTALLAMLIEDTVHSTLDHAPLINAALGVTIRGAGLTRHIGGMWGFWKRFCAHYSSLGGRLIAGCAVQCIEGQAGDFRLHTAREVFAAAQVVCAIPAESVARIAPSMIEKRLRPYVTRDQAAMGGAMVVFLGVPEDEVQEHYFTHHQLMQRYDQPLGDGNNLFISVSAPDDLESAPSGYRTVMISTHCDLAPWEGLTDAAYATRRQATCDRLIGLARRVYPRLGEQAVIREIGTPRTYEYYTGRSRGAVGGVRLTPHNANQHAIPHDLGPRGFWLVGDTTWPGLGTVACVLGSRIVTDGAQRIATRIRRRKCRVFRAGAIRQTLWAVGRKTR